MSVILALGVESGALERAPGDLLVLPFFASDRPLRGPAALADWRLCGLLTDHLVEGRVSGKPGEAVLLATGRLFRAPLALALGLGPRAGFGADGLRAAARQAIVRAVALGARDIGLAVPPESGLGVSAERAGEVSLEGAARALTERPAALSLRLLVAEDEAAAVRRGLGEAAARLRSHELGFRWISPPSAGSRPAPAPSPGRLDRTAAPAGPRSPAP